MTGAPEPRAVARLVAKALSRGESARLTLRGGSMLPTLPPGSVVQVRPLDGGELPDQGALAVYRRGDRLVLHRVQAHLGPSSLLFGGDRGSWSRERVDAGNVLGVVVAVGGSGRREVAVDGWAWRFWSAVMSRLGRRALGWPPWVRRPLGRIVYPALWKLVRAGPTAERPAEDSVAFGIVLPDECRVRTRPDAVDSPSGEDLLVLDPRTGSLRLLNSTARFAWEHCRGGIAWAELKARFRERFAGLPGERLDRELAEVVGRMNERGLLLLGGADR